MRFGNIFTADCVNTVAPTDPRCSDPAFALANPTLCPTPTTLLIKPGMALTCPFGSIQFKAYSVNNGVETDVTGEAVFASSNLDVAMIGAMSGNATGTGVGSASISATYEGTTAYSEVTVIAGDNCCSQQTVAMLLLIDTSKSMSQLFNADYASRLAFAKAAGVRFSGEVDGTKDLIGLMTFNAAETVALATPTSDTAAVETLVAGITQTAQLTAFYDALNDAIAQLASVSADQKVLAIISDGEDLTPSYNDANNPIALATDFRNGGGIVMCLGTRAAGKGYRLLSSLATGGFFINAYATNASDALDYFAGIKGYLCAGNCRPDGDEYQYKGVLNYTAFANWDVVNGAVDLQGNGFFDYLPGNGLYVDLVSGTQDPALDNKGRLESKTAFTLTAGHVYRVTVGLAGNQIIDATPYTARIRVFYLNDDSEHTPIYLLSQTVTIDDYTQDFQNFAYSFTAAGAHDVYVSVEQLDIPDDADLRVGLLLNSVKFEDITNLTTLIDDDFDTENLTYVPPKCGTGTISVWISEVAGYGYIIGTYCYGGDCLDTPPPIQAEDPSPLPDIESGTTPPPPTITYTSTKSATASCPTGSTNPNTTNLVPAMTSNTAPSGVVSASPDVTAISLWEQTYIAGMPASLAAFYAFKGTKSLDYQWGTSVYGAANPWVKYQFAAAKTIDAYEITCGSRLTVPQSWIFEGSNDGTNFTQLDSRANILPWSDAGTKRFEFINATAYLYYRFRFTKGTNYDVTTTGIFFTLSNIALFGSTETGAVTETATATATATSTISQADADTKAYDAALAAAHALLHCEFVYTSTQSYTAKCPIGESGANVTRSATATSYNSQQEADDAALAAATALAQAALDCTLSTNTQKITINDAVTGAASAATPYPTTKYVEDETGVVTKIVVSINGFTHTYPDDVLVVLRTPDGRRVELMRSCGGAVAVSGVDLVFDDEAGASLPDATEISSGTYAPTHFGVAMDFPAPLEAGPYLPNLAAACVGTPLDPNGAWSLWVIDRATLNTGTIDSWDLTLTTETAEPYLLYGFSDTARTVDEALVELMLTHVPAVANGFICPGDIMGTPALLDPEEDWQNFWDFGFSALVAETLYAPGNHDWLGESAAEQAATRSFWDGSYAAVYGGAFPATVLVTDPVDFRYTAKFGIWKFIVFNSAETDSEPNTFEPGGTAYDWIASELTEVGYQYVLVGHMPRWSAGTTHGDDATFDSLWQLAVSQGAIAWISGHEHTSQIHTARAGDGTPDVTGCTQIICGGGSSNLYAINGAYTPAVEYAVSNNALLRLILTESSLSICFVGTNGNVIAGSQVTISV